MKCIVIVGCNGFLGKNLLNSYLQKTGFYIYGIDICNPCIKNSNFEFIHFKNIKNKKIRVKIWMLYQVAWCGVDSSNKNNINIQEKNLKINKIVLNFVKNNNIKKMMYFGSMSEFSGYKKFVNGDEQPRPVDEYAKVKVRIRQKTMCFCKKRNISLAYLLITSIYSKTRTGTDLITYTITNLKKSNIVKCTMLEQKWDYIYLDDLINAIFIISNKFTKTEIFPIGSGEIHNLKYYVMIIAKYLKKEPLVKLGAIPYKNNYIDNSLPDISKISKMGFKPKHKFSYNIKKIIYYN